MRPMDEWRVKQQLRLYTILELSVQSYVGQLGFFSHAQTLVASDDYDGVYK
jgi:hypothetical protein